MRFGTSSRCSAVAVHADYVGSRRPGGPGRRALLKRQALLSCPLSRQARCNAIVFRRYDSMSATPPPLDGPRTSTRSTSRKSGLPHSRSGFRRRRTCHVVPAGFRATSRRHRRCPRPSPGSSRRWTLTTTANSRSVSSPMRLPGTPAGTFNYDGGHFHFKCVLGILCHSARFPDALRRFG